MYVIFLYLMSYRAGRGLYRHGVLGCVLSAAWGFVLMVLHIGLHTNTAFAKLYRKVRETFFAYAYILLFLLVLAAGIGCFLKSGLWKSMFLLLHGNAAFDPMRFYGEYLMITLAACQLVHLLMLAAGRRKGRS